MTNRIALRARANQFFVYSGRSLLVTNLDGDVSLSGTNGFYRENTRLLSRYELTVNGYRLVPVVASPVGGAGMLTYQQMPDEVGVPERSVAVEIAYFLSEGMRTVLRIENNWGVKSHQPDPPTIDLAINVAADFADISEADTGTRLQKAPVQASWDDTRRELCFRYCHPKLDRAVAIRVEQSPVPVRYEQDALIVSLTLALHQPVELVLVVEPVFDGKRLTAPPPVYDETETGLGRLRQRLRDETPRLTTSNATVARAWETAVSDLATLPLGRDPGPAAPIAGLPLYQQFFGRDTLTIGWQSLIAMPAMLRDALRLNAAWQGTVIDDFYDEEPGKLIHQASRAPLAILGYNPFLHYYGDYATPPDFLLGLGQYAAWTSDRETVRPLLENARKAIDWLDRYGDLDHDGFLEYVCRSPEGLKNQGWKDSWDGIIDQDGNVVPDPIAACELQGYWYVGLQQVAIAFLLAGDLPYALELLNKARDLKARFDPAFWMEDEGFYALGLGPDKEQIRSIASNAGHLLAAGIVPAEKAPRVARRLMEPDMFSGWGIRTLSSHHVAYNPFSYHLGSVWPVESGTIAFGMARYSCWPECHRLAGGLFALTERCSESRLPEVVGGIQRDEAHPYPGIYPGSNEPQGWSDGAIVVTIQALLGMHGLAPLGLLLVDPHLPDWLPDLRLNGLRVGESELDLDFVRTKSGKTRYHVRRQQGHIRVVHQPVPSEPHATLIGRLLDALGSIGHS
ncbi:glycogen debranching N-terminal domain-containing protein [Nitrolancea hollandica]|uniref:Putative Amylo-alpha-1,6-glucosidase n=1 Tax=Nitrolancea hollandica Lb TaxID=1129897 RepID=I4EEJ5_9BACT|nr:glycogen debranching N-terminal domain-containing protein [Nitrolancea hollandica]CCF83107.1 putative Amylo-alpha-1,6-glucosidase [Nitrolancea hollandica Lb]